MSEFRYEGHRISYDVYGEGERLIVLVHGLLMNRRMFDRLAPELAVIGGTSLGANIALELATRYPDRARALFIEMPVLDNALSAVTAIFAPLLLGLKIGRPVFEGL